MPACPNCQENVKSTWSNCPHCGADLDKKSFSKDDDPLKKVNDRIGKVESYLQKEHDKKKGKKVEDDNDQDKPLFG